MAKGKKIRLALVGPMPPYTGGIAQYTGQLHDALSVRSALQTISFKRQYPKWLYPGSGEVALSVASKREAAVEYTLDAYSPLSWRRTADRIIKNGCDLAVLDWWTLFWQPGFAYMVRRLRRHGVKTAFLCHNLFDHDAAGFKKRISTGLLGQADAYIVHASEQAGLLRAINPDAPILQRMHPIYDRFPAPAEAWPKRGKLELLFFGYIRPYKGLDVLVEAMKKLHDIDIYLTVAGEAWRDKAELERALKSSGIPNMELHLEYIDEAAAANYFARADVVVLPYLSATGSGVVAVAYPYKKPVLATTVGGLRDVVIEGKTGWLTEPNSPEALAVRIANIRREQITKMKPAIEEFCVQNSWDAMAGAIVSFAEKLKEGDSL